MKVSSLAMGDLLLAFPRAFPRFSTVAGFSWH
jgi:hypothetical protein